MAGSIRKFDAVERLEALDKRADQSTIDRHLEILFSDIRVGPLDFLGLFRDCLSATGTVVEGWKALRRA